ncbi:MAG TPA: coagulation factor 5/8 type domain-containing protein [Gammaproteobacteria bacterium]|nr:coagulation factor 5/8 type domain-containing protein [Gammaproteobacteria bacterium]
MRFATVAKLFILFVSLPVFLWIVRANASDCGSNTSPLFGPQVCVFNDKQNLSDIQNIVDKVHADEMDEMASHGYALLFQPGRYISQTVSLTIPVGFYTEVMGLGLTPDVTTIQAVQVTDLRNGTSLTNFWRSAENLTTAGSVTWAVSQASPLRNMDVKGDLSLSRGVYASGGFLANSTINGHVHFGNQQQWFTRNTSMGGSDGQIWNMVFVGDPKAPASIYPDTTVASTPKIQEKPYLVYDAASQKYEVIVPRFENKLSVGTDANNPYSIIPEAEFIVVQPGMTADQINAKLNNPADNNPKALIFTPGQYNFDKKIDITQANTVVLGLGLPVLTAMNPHVPIMSTEASGVKISGIIFEAGSNAPLNINDPSLLEVGDGHHGDANSPTLLADIYCRVGGRIVAQTNSCVTIHDDFVIGDNLWLWRADHEAGAGSFSSDQANHGLIVYGNNVTLYGLAVEHFQQEQVLWVGDNGSVYFYQSELPYDVPAGSVVSASFVIDPRVEQFTGYGFGIYNYFRGASGSAYAWSAIKTPNHRGISFTHMVNVTLTGSGSVKYTIQTTDGALYGPAAVRGGASFPWWQGTGQ